MTLTRGDLRNVAIERGFRSRVHRSHPALYGPCRQGHAWYGSSGWTWMETGARRMRFIDTFWKGMALITATVSATGLLPAALAETVGPSPSESATETEDGEPERLDTTSLAQCDEIYDASSEQAQAPPSDAQAGANGEEEPIPLEDLAQRSNGRDPNEFTGRQVVYRDHTIVVPPPGHTYDVFIESDNGPTYFAVCNPGAEGDLYAELSEPQPAADESTAEFLQATSCTQTGTDWNGTRAPFTFQYYTNVAGRQTHLTSSEARLGMKAGFDNSLTTRNDCGLADATSYQASLLGDTSRGFVIDGFSVMSWASFTGASASTIRDVNSDDLVIEADVRFNSDAVNFRFSRTITSGCGHTIHLDSTATHEVGHIYGFRDLGSSNNLLTMYGVLVRCSTQKSTLGQGDWDGWDDNY